MKDRKTDRVIYLDKNNRLREIDPHDPIEIPRIESQHNGTGAGVLWLVIIAAIIFCLLEVAP